MSSFPCLRCDAPIPASEAETMGACAICGQSLKVCGDRYQLTGLIGRGALGAVYSARRISDGGEVAVKVVTARGDHAWSGWSLFERSSEVLRGLKHRGLPQVYDFDRDAQHLLLVRERFDGGTLEGRIRRDQRLEPKTFRNFTASLLELLAYLEELVPPVVHRDIKPANIMFRSDDSWDPVLVDFNTVAGPAAPGGVPVVGTPGYAAPEPEMIDGQASPASDRYSLGATLLFVATHVDADRLPRKHGRFVVDGEIASLPRNLRRVLLRLVEPSAKDRYADAREALRDLDEPAPAASRPASSTSRPRLTPPSPTGTARWSVRRVITLLALVYGGVWLLVRHAQPPSQGTSTSTPPSGNSDPDVRRFQRDCDRGDANACYNLGYRYDNGKGVAQDLPRAVALYRTACDGGESFGCNNLGVMYEHGTGVAKDLSRAAVFYQKACDGKDWLACNNLGALYATGAGVPKNPARAESLYRTACDHGQRGGCFKLGWMYDSGEGATKDPVRAAALYRKACDAGHMLACANLGFFYSHGTGVVEDIAEALALYRKACDGNEALGCNNLGSLYEHGNGVEADLARAATLYRSACDGGDALGCRNLGDLHLRGAGVAIDLTRASELFLKSCQGDNKLGCDDLSQAAQAAKSRPTVREVLRKACAGGNAWACTKKIDLHVD